jgi:GNAT superfamily N-acetyltransferase
MELADDNAETAVKMNKIKIAETKEEIEKCFPVMRQLRPRFSQKDFIAQVWRQMVESTFRLVYLSTKNEIKAVGSYRIGEWLAGGKYLEIEDLIAENDQRSKGYGGELFDWIVNLAKNENCDQIKLVSHVERFGAHRFYLNKKMIIEAHYFSLAI